MPEVLQWLRCFNPGQREPERVAMGRADRQKGGSRACFALVAALDSRLLEGNWDCYLRPHLMGTNPPRCFDVVFLHFSSWAWDVSDSSLGRALRFLAQAQAPDIL